MSKMRRSTAVRGRSREISEEIGHFPVFTLRDAHTPQCRVSPDGHSRTMSTQHALPVGRSDGSIVFSIAAYTASRTVRSAPVDGGRSTGAAVGREV
jgi:hypothetical protein